MSYKKEYSELEFTDDFMFCNILISEPELCKELLELILGIRILKISQPENQKTIETTYKGKGIRLDVYVNDDEQTVYDLEMQATIRSDLSKRMRYYQGLIDLNLIQRGSSYKELKKSFVIFICTDDPFGKRLPIYRFENYCADDLTLKLNDESVKIIVNPNCDRTGLSDEMNGFLDLLQGKETDTGLAGKISEAVKKAKDLRKWEVNYVTLDMMIHDACDDAFEEGVAEGKAAGITEGTEKTVFEFVSSGEIPPASGAKRLGITVEQLKKNMESKGYSFSET